MKKEILLVSLTAILCFVTLTGQDYQVEMEQQNSPSSSTIAVCETETLPQINIRETESIYWELDDVEETVLEEIERRGSYGRLTIPDVGVDVALFYGTLYGTDNQYIADLPDSAAYQDTFECQGVQPMIADHRTQGFDKMKLSIPYETYAYIDYGTFTQSYICVDKFYGSNTGSTILTDEGHEAMYENAGGIMMYTCNSNWQDITITYWQPVTD